jgi:flavin-dependent dehydrogenase
MFPISGEGWLACGTAALGFDPLCGDGTGNAVREAILGSAAIRAAAAGKDACRLMAHYQTRLLGGFQKHLAMCLEFYTSGRLGNWWDRQLDEFRRGLLWCSRELQKSDGSRYRLNGFDLEPVPEIFAPPA